MTQPIGPMQLFIEGNALSDVRNIFPEKLKIFLLTCIGT